MSVATQERPKNLSIRATQTALATIEGIVSECNLQTIGDAGHFGRAFTLAAGIRALKEAITPDLMRDIMELQGSPLGFKTDKDLSDGYGVDVVKSCLIEAVLRGGYPVGNEFNIISGRAYMTKEFYTRAILEFPGMSNFRACPGVPAMMGEKGALVSFSATWTLRGVPATLSRSQYKTEEGTAIDERIAVRVNSGMGTDAIIGKATRKFYKQIYDGLAGIITPDGDADDAPAVSGPAPRSLSDLRNKSANGNGANGSSEPEAEPAKDAFNYQALRDLFARFVEDDEADQIHWEADNAKKAGADPKRVDELVARYLPAENHDSEPADEQHGMAAGSTDAARVNAQLELAQHTLHLALAKATKRSQCNTALEVFNCAGKWSQEVRDDARARADARKNELMAPKQ